MQSGKHGCDTTNLMTFLNPIWNTLAQAEDFELLGNGGELPEKDEHETCHLIRESNLVEHGNQISTIIKTWQKETDSGPTVKQARSVLDQANRAYTTLLLAYNQQQFSQEAKMNLYDILQNYHRLKPDFTNAIRKEEKRLGLRSHSVSPATSVRTTDGISPGNVDVPPDTHLHVPSDMPSDTHVPIDVIPSSQAMTSPVNENIPQVQDV